MLIFLTSPHLTTHLAPLTPSSPLLSPLGSFQKCLISFALMDIQLWCKTFQDWRVSSHRPSLSILYISLAFQTPPCDPLESTIQSHPSLALRLPSVSLFAILCLVAPNGKFRSGRQAAIKLNFQLWVKGACMWNGTSTTDLQVIVTLTAAPELLLVSGHFQELLHQCFLSTKAI